MGTSKQIAWSFVFAPGMLLLGLISSFLLPAAPVYAGAVIALLVAAALLIGPVCALAGAVGFCGGSALFALVLSQSGSFASLWGGWLLVLMAGSILLIWRLLCAKLPLMQVMLYTGVGVFAYLALTYIGCNLLFQDVVAQMGQWLSALLSSFAQDSPQLYDLVLSTWSSMGLLSDVGLKGAVLELDEQTRAILTADLLSLFDQSVRLNLIHVMVQEALHVATVGSLLPLMLATRRGEAERYSPLPDLTKVRIPAKVNLVLMLGVVALWVVMLFSDSGYPIYIAAWGAIQCVYALQGLSVCEWFFKKHGWSRPVRYAVMAVGYVLLPTLLFLVGFLEQILYFRKIGRPTLKDFGLSDPDDPEEDEKNDEDKKE